MRLPCTQKTLRQKCVCMSTYFTSRPHPMYGFTVERDSRRYMADWYSSMQRLGLRGVVFHDGLSSDFVREMETPSIGFCEVASESIKYPLNDQRFIVYRQYLQSHPEVERVFLTDLSDVRVASDPFPQLSPHRVYVGSQPGSLMPRNGDGCKYVDERLQAAGAPYSRFIEQLASPSDSDRQQQPIPVLNAGILGGFREKVIEVLDFIVQYLESIDKRHENLNMGLFNYVLYSHFREQLVAGPPVHSIFGGYENDRTDVWFIHK